MIEAVRHRRFHNDQRGPARNNDLGAVGDVFKAEPSSGLRPSST